MQSCAILGPVVLLLGRLIALHKCKMLNYATRAACSIQGG